MLEGTGFNGEVEVDFPMPSERLKLIGQVTLNGADAASNLDQSSTLSKIAEERIIRVDLFHEKSGKKFTDKNDLFMYSECNELLFKIAGQMLHGISLGND